PANSTQATASKVTFVATLFIPGGGEEAAAAKLEARLSTDVHHLLPRAFEPIFRKLGFDIEKYTIKMETAAHRLKPNGLHTNGGGNWNRVWKESFQRCQNHAPDRVLDQLVNMLRDFNLR